MITILSFSGQTAYSADPNKVIHTYFNAAETGFDPVATMDVYSSQVDNSIFETLYTYDYLANPSKLIPLTAAGMPQISPNGLVYTIKLKKGIYFSDDPAFHGKKRELTSYDYAYSLKRLLDPNLRSPNNWLIEGKLKGAEQLIAQAKKTGKFNYDTPIAGIQTPDRYTLVLNLNQVDYNLPLVLSHTPTSALAKEVVEKYKNQQGYAMANPIGTGPYVLAKWVPGSRILLKSNLSYRGFIWDFKAGEDPKNKALVAQMYGKKMPQIGTVDIQILEEPQSQWLAFKQKGLDWVTLSGQLANTVIIDGQLNPDVAKTGAYLSHTVAPSINYMFWNMQDPVVGGLTKDKIALRRAIALSLDMKKLNTIVYNNNMLDVKFPIPPNIIGYDPTYQSQLRHSLAVANKLLDRYHYKIDTSGYRTLPNGKALSIEYSFATNSTNFKLAEFLKRSLDALHINLKINPMQFPEYLKAQKQCRIQMGTQPWIADYPDGDNFMQLFYGKNVHSSNFNCVKIPAYDALYERSKVIPANAERQELYRKMTRILEVNASMISLGSGYTNTVVQPYILGYKQHPILNTPWMYIDIKKN